MKHTTGTLTVLAAAALLTATAQAQEAEQNQAAATQAETQYGTDEPYADRNEGQNLLEPQAGQGRPLSDYNEAMADPNILNATPASLEGQEVFAAAGPGVGTVEDVVKGMADDEVRLVVRMDTVDQPVAIPMQMFKVDEQQRLVLTEDVTQERARELQADYDAAAYSPVEQEQALGFLAGEAVEKG